MEFSSILDQRTYFGHLAIFGPLLLLAHHHDRFCALEVFLFLGRASKSYTEIAAPR